MICIGRITKSHNTSGAFLCQLFSELSLDACGMHRLSGLQTVEIRRPARTKNQAPQNSKKTAYSTVPQVGDTLELNLEQIQAIWQQENAPTIRILLKCKQWQSPEQVHPYHGWELWVHASYASPCADGEYLYCDLVGAEVYCTSGAADICLDTLGANQAEPQGKRILGHVDSLLEGGAQLLLELSLNPHFYRRQSFYLPFHHSVIGEVGQGDSGLQIEVRSLEYFESLLENVAH